MDDPREELKREVLRIDDSATLGKVEAFVRGMQAEKEIGRRCAGEAASMKRPGKPAKPEGGAL